MKTKITAILLAIGTILGLSWSCAKIEEPMIDLPLSLPEETQAGANTFGCKVNGEVWRVLTEQEDPYFSSNELSATKYSDSIISIWASDHYIDPIPHYSFHLLFNLKSNAMVLSTADSINYIDMWDRTNLHATSILTCSPCGITYRSCKSCESQSGTIVITTFNERIISGRFSGNLSSRDGNETVITEGRFDIPLKK